MELSLRAVKAKRSKKQRKTQTTRAYRKTEKEVQSLLSHCNDNDEVQTAQELEARSLQFFHGSVDNDSFSLAQEEDVAEQYDASLAASFIQIELSESPLVWPQLSKQRHYHDNSLLFKPSNKLQLPLQLSECEPQLSKAQVRMLNRYQEQARSQCGSGKLDAKLVTELTQATTQTQRFVIDSKLYRSNCNRVFKSVFMPPTPLSQCQGLPTRYCLKLCLKHLRFTTHPQLLEEHKVAQQLEDLYELYAQQLNRQLCDKLRQELQLARHVAAQLLQLCREQQPQLVEQLQRQLRLTQELRERYYAECAAQRSLLQRLLAQWAQLKELRRQQQSQCTRLQLNLRVVQPSDLNATCAAWKQRFETDLAEVYREHLQHYKQQRRLWSNAQLTKSQLKPPRKPQFNDIMAKLKAEYELAFPDPEEPEVHVLRQSVDESTLQCQATGSEARNYFLKIYLDAQFVAQSRNYRLESDLHLYMNEIIGVMLDRTLPQELNIWLYEKSTLTSHNRRLAQMSLPLAVTKDGSGQQKLGFQLESTGTRAQLAGELFLHTYYHSANGAEESDLDVIQPLAEELRQALLPVRLPELPESKPKTTPRAADAKHKPAGIVFAEEELQLCRPDQLLDNKRLRLLHSRHQQRNVRTKQLRFVPALEHEIGELEQLTSSAQLEQLLEPGSNWNPIDLHKHRGRKFLQLLYETIGGQCAQRAKAMETPVPLLLLRLPDGQEQEQNTSDVGIADGWLALWRAFCALFTRQPARPTAREPIWQPQQSVHELHLQQFNVSLHVVRATGVPVRSRHILNVEERRRSSAGTSSDLSTSLFVTQTLMYSNVRPFVTLSYGQRLCRSRTAEGSNPTWNEQLQLQIAGEANELREDLKISLFDELIEQQFTDEAADLYQRVQCNWLGEYRVPISRLLAQRKFEGCIELCMPKVLVGYKRPLIESVTNIAADLYPEFKESVHLWFYLSIEPSNELPPLQVEALACSELPELQQFLRERRLELQQLLPQPQRYVEPLVCTAEGKRVCLTRLLQPVPLPQSLDQQLESVCRFVSLLCQLRQFDVCQGFRGVWLDNRTLLDSTWCSAKDLGVLLCNFMLALGLECWLLLGLACPYGECSFVIYRQPQSGELLLIAPATGKRYQLQDIFCPLTRVHCVVGQENIYFNMQTETRVSMTNFNLTDGACWLPLFNKRQAAPQGGVHKLDYVYKRSYELSELQKHIERKIMKKVSSWRSTRKTIWNRAFQPRLLRILSEMENLSIYTSSRYDEPAYSEELEREFPNYRLYGFTINFAYTNLAAISERIRTSCIHYNNNALVEFCVAVHINAYANDVISVWVFLLSMVPLVA
ncbi:coiled-coil and C2 domain-containing protein 2A [Drosophila busckii]|uniref:coiled-coil and C2 domain-containing protein 2A n=1 Tax=Drosophila busckii TaxID=30019 RepID=UPI00083F3B06|nr:coiled-coil and C2 domain-containing protein 2A [Drosophila busckii]